MAGSSQMMACVERKDRRISRSRAVVHRPVRCLTSSNRAQGATLYLRRPSVTRRFGWYCRPCSKRLKKGSVSTHASGLGKVNRPEHEVVPHGWGERGCGVSDWVAGHYGRAIDRLGNDRPREYEHDNAASGLRG